MFQDHPLNKLPEHSWAALTLGKDIFGGSNQKHTLIRKIIIEYLASTSMRVKIMLLLGTSLIALNLREWWYMGASLWVLALIYLASQGRIYAHYAAVLWATFRDGREIRDSEAEDICRRFQAMHWIDKKVRLVGCLLNLIIFGLLIYFLGLLKGVGVLIFSFILVNWIVNVAHAAEIRVFRKELKDKTSELLKEYEDRWLGNLFLDSEVSTIRNGHLIFGGYLLALILIKISRSEGAIFNIYLFLLIIGSVVVLGVSESIRSKVIASPEYLRKPRAPFLSRVLSLHVVHSLVLDCAWLMFTLFALFSATSGSSIYIYFVAVVFLVPMCRFSLANGTIKLTKWMLDYNFNIVVFRRFSGEFASANRTLIAPTFGAYGKITSIWDDTLEKAQAGANGDSESVLSERHEMLHCGNHNWQRRVICELKNADLVVFHWEDLPTLNMEWEFSRSLEHIVPERLIFICDERALENVRAWIQDKSQRKGSRMKFITINKDTGYLEFGVQVYKLLRELESTPRPRG